MAEQPIPKTYQEAQADPRYAPPKTTDRITWLMPLTEHTFAGVENGFHEMPTFLRCDACGVTARYTQRRFAEFGFRHGDMCRG